MKIAMISLLVAVMAVAYGTRPVMAADHVDDTSPGDAVVVQADEAESDDDDVWEVQVFVLGAVILTVFVAGTGAYFLRKRLGLTAYTPPADTGHH